MSLIKSADWPKADRKNGWGYQTKKTLRKEQSRDATVTSELPDKAADAEDNYAALRKGTEPHD